jgi:thiamine pyrophosphokinase
MKAIVFAAGRLIITPRIRAMLAASSLVIAADGGMQHALALGITPALWVGDFDSSSADLQAIVRVKRQQHPRNKNQIDTELALEQAQQHGASSISILGAFGGRFDHALALALIAAHWTQTRLPVSLDSGDEAGYIVLAEQSQRLTLHNQQTFSLLALQSDAIVSVEGAEWPLEQAVMPFGSGFGISNEALGEVDITVIQGCVLVVVQYTIKSVVE